MGYLHGVKPKMTGGLDQGSMPVSPEVHKEWKDSQGKHTIDAGVKEAPKALAGRESNTLSKNENPEKQSNKVAAGSHVPPAKRGGSPNKTIGKQTDQLKKAVPAGGMGAKGGSSIKKSLKD